MQIRSLSLAKSITTTVVTLTFISLPAIAVTVEQVPNSRRINGGWVTDTANILTPQTEAQLNQMISELEAKNGSEIAVVTVPDTAASATPKQFATALFNRLKIGKAGQNNGVLFLISTGNRRVEIETGTGLQTILPNFFVTNIIKQEITPRFKQNDYDGGTIAGTKALVVTLQNYQPVNNVPVSSVPLQQTQPVPVQTYSNSSDSYGRDFLIALVCFIVGVFLVIFVIFYLIYRFLKAIFRSIFQAQPSQNQWQTSPGYTPHPTYGSNRQYVYNNSNETTYVNVENEVDCGNYQSNNYEPSYSPDNSSYSSDNNNYSTDNNSYSSDNSSSSSYESSSSSDYGGGCSSGDGGGDSW